MTPEEAHRTCPVCQGDLRRVLDQNKQPLFQRLQLLNHEHAVKNDLMLGGSGIVSHVYICGSCGFVACFYDHVKEMT